MRTLIYAFLILSTTIDYLHSMQWAPASAPYFIDVFSGFLGAYVFVGLVRSRFQNMRIAYVVMLAFLGVVFVCSVVANNIDAGPVLAGSRLWLRMLPFFVLPAVVPIDDRTLWRQLMLLLGICMLQFPLALSQRFHEYGHEFGSGDRTFGTLMGSGIQSIFLICAACVLAGFFIRKRISLSVFAPLVLWTLASTTINETKATFILAPVGFIATFLAGTPPERRVRNGLLALAVTVLFLIVFVQMYDAIEGVRNKESVVDFFLSDKQLANYLSSSARGSAKAAKVGPGRVETLTGPLGILARDPANLAFGVGPGNAGDSSLGPQFAGRYAGSLGRYIQTTGSRLLAELGLLGIGGTLMLLWLILADSRYLAYRDSSTCGALAIGWTGVVPVMVISMFYSAPSLFIGVSVPFWYLSGVLATRRAALSHRPSIAAQQGEGTAVRFTVDG